MKLPHIISALIPCLMLGCTSSRQYVFQTLPGELTDPTPEVVVVPVVAPRVIAPPVTLANNKYEISVKAARILNGRVVNAPPGTGVAVVNFPIGQLPELNRTLSVYRNGVGVGEILITGPQRDDNIAAEIIRGNIQPGDEARDH